MYLRAAHGSSNILDSDTLHVLVMLITATAGSARLSINTFHLAVFCFLENRKKDQKSPNWENKWDKTTFDTENSLIVFSIKWFTLSQPEVTRGQKLDWRCTRHVLLYLIFLGVFLFVLHVFVLKSLRLFSRAADKWTSLFIFGSLAAGASVCSAPITPGDVC